MRNLPRRRSVLVPSPVMSARLAGRWLVPVLVVALGASRTAAADAVADKAAAESLFREARRLLQKGDVARACEKFASSQRLEPAVGSLLNLAACEERLGRTASAWVHYQEAEALARRLGDGKRREGAQRRAAALEPTLARVVIRTPGDPRRTVTRDGSEVDPAAFGTAVPVDPGRHEVHATADGAPDWVHTFEVGAGQLVEVVVPPLPAPAAALAPAPVPLLTRSEAPPAPESTRATRVTRIIGWSALAVGAVGLTVGIVSGLDARAKHNRAQARGPDGSSTEEAAGRAADRSTVGFAVGALGLATGATLWFTGRF